MKERTNNYLETLCRNYSGLNSCRDDLYRAFSVIGNSIRNNKKILVCGNGGSAADSEHIVGELMKGFRLKRRLPEKDRLIIQEAFPEESKYLVDSLQGAIPAVSLVSQTSLLSAIINDLPSELVFAQQVYGYGKEGDVLIAISTSGNSANVINAAKLAKAFKLKTVALTGADGGILGKVCDVAVKVPGNDAAEIQELQLPVYHCLCAMLESEFFDE